jgi:LCP family protein required for cell wall assembly
MLDQLDDPVPFALDEHLLDAIHSRGARLRRHRRAHRALALVPIVLAVALLAGAAWVDHRTDQVDRVDVAAGLLTPVVGDEPFNVLVVGTDAQPAVEGQRTDTQMIVRIDRGHRTVSVLSLPRDLVLPGDTERLNAKLGEGGPDALIAAIRDGLGLSISHYVAVDFNGFARLVDAAGGISVQTRVEYRDDQTGTHLYPGCQHLDGEATLGLVRSRHLEQRSAENAPWVIDAAGDLGRVRTQQVVIAQLLRQLQERAADPATLDQLLTVFADNTTVDAGFSRRDLLDLTQWSRGFHSGSIAMETLPVDPGQLPDGARVLQPSQTATAVIDSFEQGTAPVDPSAGPPDLFGFSTCP